MGNWRELGGNAYWRIHLDDARGVLILQRTPQPFESVAAIGSVHAELTELLRAHPGRRRVLLDFRHGPPGRNDPAFENATESARRALSHTFERVAVLVRTAAGKLQVARLQKAESASDDAAHNVFTEEEEAFRWLTRAGA